MLGDTTLRHLRQVADWPDLAGTRFDLIAPIGRGGMGAVYRVRDRDLERDVALKVLSGMPGPDSEARFEAEARVLGRLEHAGIVPVHEVGRLSDGRLYYVMKLVRGERLDVVAPRAASLAERLRPLIRAADAVAFAHAHGITHRDLTPANIMVGPYGEVLVVDWGLALVRDDHSAQPNDRLAAGTPGFMAPEQARGVASPASDVYALGAIIAWSLRPSRGGPSRLPRPLASIVAKAMAAEPVERYATAESLAADLSRFLDGESVSAHRDSVAERLWRFVRKYRIAILLIVGYLLMRITLLLVRGL